MSGFENALAFVLQHEGGFVDIPADPGGATNFGITQRTFAEWLAARGQPVRFVKTITMDEVRAIYQELYWDRYDCELLKWPLFAFDAYVQHRPETVQTFLNAASLADALWMRVRYYSGLANFNVFGRGWVKRMCDLRAALAALGEPI